MNAIYGFSQILKDSSFTDTEKKQYIDLICNQTDYLLSIVNELIDISKPMKTFEEVTKLKLAVEAGGEEKRRICSSYNGEYCERDGWTVKPETDQPNGELVSNDKGWYLNPNTIFCAVCPDFMRGGLASPYELEEELANISQNLNEARAMVDSTPDLNLRHRFICKYCGAGGFVAVRIQCTNCKTEDWWGWHKDQ